MKYLTIILLLIVTVITVKAQNKSQGQIDQLDELLFDSQYDEVIKRVDQYKASDPYQDIIVFNKKAEALIRLGNFDEANEWLKQTIMVGRSTPKFTR